MAPRKLWSRIWRSRRASFSVMLALFITVAGGLVIGGAGYKIAQYLNKEDDVQRCSLSIFAASQALEIRRKTATAFELIPTLDCPPKEIEVKPKDITVTGRTRGRIDDSKFKLVYADAMKDCWAMAGKGDNLPIDIVRLTDMSACMICAKITLSPELKKKVQEENYQMKNLGYFMAMRRIPKETLTYYEYLWKTRPTPEQIKQLEAANNVIPITEKLYVVWRMRLDVDAFAKNVKTHYSHVTLLTSSQISGYNIFGDEFDTCTQMLNG